VHVEKGPNDPDLPKSLLEHGFQTPQISEESADLKGEAD
jgi:hypothetical protein